MKIEKADTKAEIKVIIETIFVCSIIPEGTFHKIEATFDVTLTSSLVDEIK